MQRHAESPDARRRTHALGTRGEPVALKRHPAEVERGRRHVAEVCHGLSEDVVTTAALLASELITNALRHGTGSITLLVTRARDAIRVDVADESPVDPRPRSAAPEDENGRGLLIVDALADDWGMEPLARGAGKSVWFALGI